MKVTKTTTTVTTTMIEFSYWFYNRSTKNVEEVTDTVNESELNRKDDDGEPCLQPIEDYVKENFSYSFATKEAAIVYAKDKLSQELTEYQRGMQQNKEKLNQTIHAIAKLEELAKVS